MSGYLNRVQLIGNLGQDPEVRHTQGGKPVVTLSIATGESWRDERSGERRERTEWHRVVSSTRASAGSRRSISSRARRSTSEVESAPASGRTSPGADRYSTEVHLTPYNGTLTFLDSRKDGDRASGGSAPRESSRAGAGDIAGGSSPDDDIPF